jgi:hypothetical protein
MNGKYFSRITLLDQKKIKRGMKPRSPAGSL